MSRYSLGSMLVLLSLMGLTACATAARQIGGATAEGAVQEIRQQQEKSAGEEDMTAITRMAAEQATQGVLDALSQPERQAQIRQLVDTMVEQSLRSVAGGGVPGLGDGPGGGGGAGVGGAGAGGAGMSPASRLSADLARGMGAEMERLLGPDGTGPLAQSMAATAGQVAASVIKQSRDELGTLFPECAGLQGEAARACMEERVAQLGAAFSRGATEGARDALRPWLLLLSFAGGLLVGLLVFLGWSAARVNRELGGRGGLLRQRRPA